MFHDHLSTSPVCGPPHTAMPNGAGPPGSPPPSTLPPSTLPPRALSNSALESEVVGLAGHLAAAHCRWLLMLAEFDNRDGWGGPGLRSCAHWLSWRVGMNLRTAFEQLRVAHALTRLPLISAAFETGRISYSKVRAMTRVATAGTEDTLLALALAGTASHVERVVRAIRQARADPAEVHAGRRLDWTWNDDGSLQVRVRLTPEQGTELLNALAGVTDKQAPRVRGAGAAGCSAEQSTPDGFGSDPGFTPLSANPSAPTETVDVPIEALAARRADALIALVTGTGSTRTGISSGAQVVLHIDAEQGTAQIENGPSVPMASAERLVCGARVQALLKDRRGNPLYLGRTHRLASKKLIAAVSVRDQHRCRWIGCTATRHLDAHHIRHWLRGGRTDVHNLTLLCDYHHRLIHDHGYSMRGFGTDVTFHRPDGQLIPDAGPPTEGRSDAVREISSTRGITITDDALTPTWAGERLDPTGILELLLAEPTIAAAA